MPGEGVNTRLAGIEMPEEYRTYYKELSDETTVIFNMAAAAKAGGADSSEAVGPKIAFDLADRVSKMHDIDIAEPLRHLLQTNGKELSALMLAEEIALGRHHDEGASLEERLDLAVRVGLAVVTEGVTIAPLQGINEVVIKENKDGTRYLSISIAGPMRSAGGTESAVTMLIADHVRKAAGLDRYQANSYDDEAGRFVEELRIYERDASNFQYHVHDEDIEHVIRNLPVELDGVDTDPYEVVNHKSMKRISTDRVRGGALRVLNDGLIGRSKKLLKRIELYKLDGWEWLAELRGAVQTGADSKEDAGAKRMREVITGRSVLSMPGRPGGFRLRYGRSCNTGFAAVGFHPVVAEILEHTIAVGTQIKTDIPGKGASVAFVDSIETPTVVLASGDVVKIRDVEHGIEIKSQIVEILHMGDVLISFGDFLENNAQLKPSGYVEEFWAEDLQRYLAGDGGQDGKNALEEFLTRQPTAEEAVSISLEHGVPLHPRHLYFWDTISPAELALLLRPKAASESAIEYLAAAKPVLEKAGIPHTLRRGTAQTQHREAAGSGAGGGNDAGVDGDDDTLLVGGPEATILNTLLFRRDLTAYCTAGAGGKEQQSTTTTTTTTVPEILSASGIRVNTKSSAYIGVRIGRPEKAAAREMTPPTHVLFPVGGKGGPTRDLVKASKSSEHFVTDLCDRFCPDCKAPLLEIVCPTCYTRSKVRRHCSHCREETDDAACARCQRPAAAHTHLQFPLKAHLLRAQERMEMRAQEPLKGVKGLISEDKVAEPLEKGVARQKFGLTAFKDGTVRFDATNSPLTQFRPAWIRTSIERLRALGYTRDMDGRPLEDSGQMVEMRMQDVIIPYESGRYLLSAAKYVDALLARLYGVKPFYNIRRVEDLAGHLVIGLAPHTSVGIVGRIVGFADTHVCFATPNWHSAKRRDADGDADSIMLLMDGLLNFSKDFLSDKIGGLMDVPLLVQPLVLPHESQPQAHNLEVTKAFPLEFFKSTLRGEKATDVRSVEVIGARLDTARQFYDYFFTHATTTLTTSRPRSAYSVLPSMRAKLDLQIKNADLIRAVDTSETVLNVITTHLVPDIMGNLRAYAQQSFRCTSCSKQYRRMPLSGKCSGCGSKLILNITRSTVEKYLTLTKSLAKRYDIGRYQRGRIAVLADETDLVFGKSSGDQAILSDYM